MFDEETRVRRKRKLVWAAVAVVIMVTIAVSVAYVNLSNALRSALSQSLNTFELDSVAYPSVEPGSIEVKITFRMRNPASYTVKVSAIMLSFWIDERDIGLDVNVKPNQDLAPGEESPFDFFRNITDPSTLASLNNSTYELTMKGKISASVSYFIIGASRSRDIDSAREVSGMDQA